jgi:uncharacterized protein
MTSTASQRPGLRPTSAANDQPWWRYRMLWLVVGGPAVVVVASIVTGVIAARGADPVLDHDDGSTQQASGQAANALMPALQARNHAATPKP